jgi:hypothetical protein
VGVPVACKTQTVDLADDAPGAAYVAVSNTVIGVLLLGAGAMLSAALALGPMPALALGGAGLSLTLPHAQAEEPAT